MSSLATDGQGPFGTRTMETAYDVLGRATLQRLPAFSEQVSNGALVSWGEMPFSRQAYDRWAMS